MRDQIPALVEKCVFLSNEARTQVLNNYKTLPEERITKLISKLKEGYKKQTEFLKKKKEERANEKIKQHDEMLQKLQADEALSRQEEAIELRSLEDEINSLF